MFKASRIIGGYCYVLEYMNNALNLYIDVLASPKRPIGKYDPFADFYDFNPRIVYQIENREVIKVKAFVDEFVHSFIRKEKPYYFTYSANEDSKVSVYKKYAERVADKYGYCLEIRGRGFKFFKC